MAEEAGGGRRASGRVRKPVDRLSSAPSKKQKRNAANGQENDPDSEPEIPSETESEADDFSEEERPAPKSKRVPKKRTSTAAAAATTATTETGTDEENSAEKGKPKKRATAAKRAPRKKKSSAAAAADDGENGEDNNLGIVAAGKGDVNVNDDNQLFNAVRNPNTALQTTADDWVQSYEEDAGQAMAELVNFLLRCCGCNAAVDEHQAMDENGIVETINEIQEQVKNEISFLYPIISRTKAYKKFRSSLSTFLSKLYATAASAEILYSTQFCDEFQAWVNSLTSSKVRAFRHTATFIALQTTSALNAVHVAVKKELATANRAKEAEQKKGKKDKARQKDLEKAAKEIQAKQIQLGDFLQGLYETVFMNRYRDKESLIRAECIQSIGHWMKSNPDYWLETEYLQYIGWVLSDEAKETRKEAVRALFSLYANEAHIGTLQNFTERFKGQLVRMGVGETDLGVRVQTIQVLRQIESHGLLDEIQRDQIAQLVYETERRVRHAAADFFAGLVQEQVNERSIELEAGTESGAANSAEEKEMKIRLELKCLAELMIKSGKSLDAADETEEREIEAQDNEFSQVIDTKTHRARAGFAVEALWDSIESIKDYKSIINYLLLDTSSAEAEATPKAKRGKKTAGKNQAAAQSNSEKLAQISKLTESEETLLVEILIACLTQITQLPSANATKKDKEAYEETVSELSRFLIEALPKLFAKHQTVPNRVIDLLSIPRMISLETYVDMRNVTAYETLWDDVTKQFTQQSESNLLQQAAQTIQFLVESKTFSQTNSTKLDELKDSLVASLREVAAGTDLESANFEEEQIETLTNLCARIDFLYKKLNLSESLNETEGEKVTSAWEIIDSLANRGKFGYREEAKMVEHCLSILHIHGLRMTQNVLKSFGASDQVEAESLSALKQARKDLLDKLQELSFGTGTNAAESVKRRAVTLLLEIYTLAVGVTNPQRDPNGQLAELSLDCSDELQARCSGYIEAEIERHAEALAALKADEQENEISAERTRLMATSEFHQTVSPFVRAIHSGAFELRHCVVIVANLGRFDAAYESWAKLFIQDLRDEGIYSDAADSAADIITESLQTACNIYLDHSDETDESLLSLGRHLVQATVVRGPQLAIIRKLPADEHTRIHLESLDYVIERIAAYEQVDKLSDRNRAINFFKPLNQLLLGLQGRSALTVKNRFDELISSHAIEISDSSKNWEPARSYRKRLLSLMAKDPSIKLAAQDRVKATKRAAETSEGEGAETGNELEEEEDAQLPPSVPKKTAKRTPKKARQSSPARGENDSEEERLPPRKTVKGKRNVQNDDSENDDVGAVLSRPAKRRKLAAADDRKQREETAEAEDEDDNEINSLLLNSSQRGSAQKKRSEEQEEEEQEEEEDEEIDEDDDDDDDNASVVSLSELKRGRVRR